MGNIPKVKKTNFLVTRPTRIPMVYPEEFVGLFEGIRYPFEKGMGWESVHSDQKVIFFFYFWDVFSSMWNGKRNKILGGSFSGDIGRFDDFEEDNLFFNTIK